MAEANRVRVSYRAAGTTDDWQVLRRYNDALTVGTETVMSDEIRDDRKKSDQKVVTLTVGGTLDMELSANSIDPILAAAFMSTFAADTPVVGSEQLTVGTTTVKLDILKSYLDEGRDVLMEEMEVAQMSITMATGSKIEAQVTFAGTTFNEDYDASGDTFVAASDEIIMDSSNNLGTFLIDGSPISGMCFTNLTLEIDNGHSTDQCLGELNQNHFKGSAMISGSLTVRSSTAAFDLWGNTITNTPIQLTYTLSDGTTQYVVDVARAYLAGDLPSGAQDSILSFDLTFSGAAKSNGDYVSITKSAV